MTTQSSCFVAFMSVPPRCRRSEGEAAFEVGDGYALFEQRLFFVGQDLQFAQARAGALYDAREQPLEVAPHPLDGARVEEVCVVLEPAGERAARVHQVE